MKGYIFAGEHIIYIKGVYYKAKTLKKYTKLKKDCAYLMPEKGILLPYMGKVKKTMDNDNLEPGIWLLPEGGLGYVYPDKSDIAEYDYKNMVKFDTKSILNYIANDKSDGKSKILSTEEIEIINNNTDIYTPTIKDDDDFLKYLIKRAIIDKKINLKNYRDKFGKDYDLTNKKSSLNRKTKMSVEYFNDWCEILGLKWKMTLMDSGTDEISSLPNPIHIKSEDFK